MYNSIIASNMFTLRGSHELERMDDTQLADLGIECQGNAFLHDGQVVYEIPRFEALTFLSRIVTVTLAEHLHSARA
jgi:hypothetical protein